MRRTVAFVACVFAVVLWARSYRTVDWLWYRRDTADEGMRSVAVASCRGTIAFSFSAAVRPARVNDEDEAGFNHYRVDATDLLIDPVPPDMRLRAGFGAMTTRPRDFDERSAVVWRFLVIPWWGVLVLGVSAGAAPGAAAHASSLTRRTYASMSNFLSSPAAFMKRTVPKIGRGGPHGRSCKPNSHATLA